MINSSIDKLVRERKNTILKRDTLKLRMQERNAVRDNKIKKLEHDGYEDYEKTNKRIFQLERKLDKIIREIDNEKRYVNDIAESEFKEHAKEEFVKERNKTLKK